MARPSWSALAKIKSLIYQTKTFGRSAWSFGWITSGTLDNLFGMTTNPEQIKLCWSYGCRLRIHQPELFSWRHDSTTIEPPLNYKYSSNTHCRFSNPFGCATKLWYWRPNMEDSWGKIGKYRTVGSHSHQILNTTGLCFVVLFNISRLFNHVQTNPNDACERSSTNHVILLGK